MCIRDRLEHTGALDAPAIKELKANLNKVMDWRNAFAHGKVLHEREVSTRLGVPVEFMPHVAPHFRGITLTANLWLHEPVTVDQVRARYEQRYAGEPLVDVIDQAPWVSRIAGRHGVEIGGFAVAPGGKRLVVVATEDNLLKGAATQAMQNINIALGFDELASIPVDLSLIHT